MKKGARLFIALIFVAACGIDQPVCAARHPHRPWLMLHSGHAPEITPARRSAPPVSRAAFSRRTRAARMKSPAHPAGGPSMARANGPALAPSSETHPDKVGAQVVSQALSYRGTRYRFGGTTKRGLDCSGLVARVYEDLKRKRGPRVSSALDRSGKPVALSNLRPGDLVFFKNTYRRGISHVGIYAGHNKFVHAADHRHGVIVTALSDPYFQLHYAGARRLY